MYVLSSSPSISKKNKNKARCWWLKPIILTTWETDTGWITVLSFLVIFLLGYSPYTRGFLVTISIRLILYIIYTSHIASPPQPPPHPGSWFEANPGKEFVRPPHLQNNKSNMDWSQVPAAHVCNPSYSGGRDQEDRGLKPAQANNSRDPILNNPSQQKG
jgi:hypothetical protein